MLREERERRSAVLADTQDKLLGLLGEDARPNQLARGLVRTPYHILVSRRLILSSCRHRHHPRSFSHIRSLSDIVFVAAQDLLCSVVECNGVVLVEKEGCIYKSGTAPSDAVIRNIWTHCAHETERAGVYAIDRSVLSALCALCWASFRADKAVPFCFLLLFCAASRTS